MSEEKNKGRQGAGLTEVTGVTGTTKEGVQSPLPLHKPVEGGAVDEPTQRRRTKAPAVTVDQDGAQGSEAIETGGSMILKRSFAKKISSTVMEFPSPSETIVMKSTEIELQKSGISQPIPPGQMSPIDTDTTKSKKLEPMTPEKESLAEVVTELPPEIKHSEWSDEEEAGALPRTESRASRMSRAMWHLFCCGRPVHASSEENIPGRDGFSI